MTVTLDAERMVLAAILRDNALLPEAEAMLKPEHFSDTRNQVLYRAMQTLSEHGRVIDELSIRDELQTSASLHQAGGMAYLSVLDDGMPRVSSLEHWAGIVRAKALRRSVLALGQRLVQTAGDPALSTDEVIDSHAQQLNRLLDAQVASHTQHIREIVGPAYDALEKFEKTREGITGIPSGLSDLDRLTGGFQPGALNIIAARPARGKTVLVMQIAVAAATAGFKGVCFSLEMPPEAVVQRAILSDANVDKWDELKYADAERAQESWARIRTSMVRLSGLPLWFDAREQPTLTQIRAICRKFKATSGLDFVVIDYLQRIPVPGKADRHVEIGDIAQALKSLSRTLAVPLIVACQLNRDAEEKEPNMGDLAESGRIEREADTVSFLHPEDIQAWQTQDFPQLNLIVAKHRAGPCDRLALSFEKKYARFVQVGTRVNWGGEL